MARVDLAIVAAADEADEATRGDAYVTEDPELGRYDSRQRPRQRLDLSCPEAEEAIAVETRAGLKDHLAGSRHAKPDQGAQIRALGGVRSVEDDVELAVG